MGRRPTREIMFELYYCYGLPPVGRAWLFPLLGLAPVKEPVSIAAHGDHLRALDMDAPIEKTPSKWLIEEWRPEGATPLPIDVLPPRPTLADAHARTEQELLDARTEELANQPHSESS